jgi:hypothetical protein
MSFFKKSVLCILAVPGVMPVVANPASCSDPPIHHLQFIGTHNSYHVAPDQRLLNLIERLAPGEGRAIDYTHRPLREQFETLGIRQIELDLFSDPAGGVYAQPLGGRLVGQPLSMHPAMLEPGLKILHSPDFDFATTVPTLRLALRELRDWSKENPDHEPVLVLLELKERSFSPAVRPPLFDASALQGLEAEIRAELSPGMIFTPDDLRGSFSSVRDAVLRVGWPRLSAMRGKFIFALDNEDHLRDLYLALSPEGDLRERLLFVSVAADHPGAAWMKRNNPVRSFDEIQQLVAAGFLVRTRADAGLHEIRAQDLSRFERAAASGAQWISTDAPEPDPRWPEYQVAWPDKAVFRINPRSLSAKAAADACEGN